MHSDIVTLHEKIKQLELQILERNRERSVQEVSADLKKEFSVIDAQAETEIEKTAADYLVTSESEPCKESSQDGVSEKDQNSSYS